VGGGGGLVFGKGPASGASLQEVVEGKLRDDLPRVVLGSISFWGPVRTQAPCQLRRPGRQQLLRRPGHQQLLHRLLLYFQALIGGPIYCP
jgi:hypothetical protein